jgi:HK97 family phage prohead protease
MTYNDYPKAATNNAKRALKYREESGNPKGCGTPVGWARANQLAKGEALSEDTVKRMASFNRHRQHKDVPYEDGCGGLMWDAWGGTEGVDWAIRKSKQIDEEKNMKAEAGDLKVGDFVSWDSSGGRAKGKIIKIHTEGSVDIPDSALTITASEDDPVALIKIYRGDEETDRIVGHKFSTLRKINSIKNAMNLPWITKDTSAEIKGVDLDRRIIEGYYSVFDFKDSDGDVMLKGCYEKTIKENGPNGKNRIMHLYQHDPLQVLGKPVALMEDEKGLYFRTLIADTTLGTDVLKLYRDGVLKEHSVGINFIQREYDSQDDAYLVKECKMWEGSTVTWGANELSIGGMAKGNVQDQVDKYKELSKAFYSGDYTDETFRLIEAQLKHIEQSFKDSLQTKKPIQVTLKNEAELIENVFKQFNNQLKIEKEFKQWT